MILVLFNSALVVQRIGRKLAELETEVRFLAGANEEEGGDGDVGR